jgi:hypothetical protein
MLTVTPEYLRMKAARFRQLARDHGGDDAVAQQLWRLAEDMETLARDAERQAAP